MHRAVRDLVALAAMKSKLLKAQQRLKDAQTVLSLGDKKGALGIVWEVINLLTQLQ